MTNPRCFRITVLTTLLFATGLLAQEVAFLDLTSVRIRSRQKETSSATVYGGSVGGVGIVQLSEPLRVTLLSVDRSEYRWGEDLVYEVRLHNVGDKPMAIPWNPHAADIEAAHPDQGYEYTRGSIALIVQGENGEWNLAETVSLYGSAKLPKTIRTVAPGEWVRIRAKEKLRPSDPGKNKVFPGRQDSVHVKASFSLYRESVTPRVNGYRLVSGKVLGPIVSENAISIRVLSGQPPH